MSNQVAPNRTLLIALTVVVLASTLPAAPAAAQFLVAGRKVPPQETNFAGARRASPRYGLVVQINHDARLPGDFDLDLVDETYGGLLRQHRTSAVPAELLPVVFVSEAKMARFGEGPRRRMFRWFESEPRPHPDVHLSPAAIFISDDNLADREKLKSALNRALGYLFDRRFRDALESVEHPTPDRR
jgi:hypothetical protein